jgi:2,3,4,5-tetrahydropyridine-2-carboxylate N-succinyltransferase
MENWWNKDMFEGLFRAIEGGTSYTRPIAYGFGIARCSEDGSQILDTYFPVVNFGANFGVAAVAGKLLEVMAKKRNGSVEVDEIMLRRLNGLLSPFAGEKGHPNVEALQFLQGMTQSLRNVKAIATFIYDVDSEICDTPDAYFRLHLLSHRLVKPHGIGLKGLFAHLPNVAWTNEGPIAISELPQRRHNSMLAGRELLVHSVDKFPRMTDYVVPSGVRIADSARVRLGAYIGEGSTFMHEGFCNFNAGCEGPNMIEGRISSGVFVGKGSDLGGGSSTMGTLSGGGKEVISIGERCLIGANAGTGISLGDNCTIEAGLYLTAGTKIKLRGKKDSWTVRARELSGRPNLLYRRNSQTGEVEAYPNGEGTTLNDVLHTKQ